MLEVMTRDFPNSEDKVKSLIAEHRKLKNEPLLLALYYAPDRDAQDIFVLEIMEGFGANAIDPDEDLFEVTYETSSAFATNAGQKLHLLLSNPVEVEVAFRDGWKGTAEIREAVKRNDFRTIYIDPVAHNLLELIRGE